MTATTTERAPWDRQPDETRKAFAGFLAYRDAGPARSVQTVAAECNRSRSLFNRWSSLHQWRVRTDAWDSEVNRRVVAKVAEATVTLALRHHEAAEELLAKVKLAAARINPDDLSASEVARWLEVASKVEREALGLPHRFEFTGRDGGPVQVRSTTTWRF